MHVQKTLPRQGWTIAHGVFDIHETVHFCKRGCRWPNGQRITLRPKSLAELILPNASIGYDVMVHVGLARFVRHLQRSEIQSELEQRYGLRLSTGELSNLAVHFLDYLHALHIQRAPALRDAMARDGGWPMHIDATGESGRGTVFAILDGWRGWVLGAWRLSTERADLLLPHLTSTVEHFGAPCAIMRDLGRAVRLAANDLNASLSQPIRILSCHQHFLRDVGKDLLDADHQNLRQLFRQFKVRPKLRALARELGRTLDEDLAPARVALLEWQKQPPQDYVLSGGLSGLGVVRGLTQWVLDFPADGQYRHFPFDQPYLDLYNRCVTARRAVDSFLQTPPSDQSVLKPLLKLARALEPVMADVPFGQVAKRLRGGAAYFEQLRNTLRLRPQTPHDPKEAPDQPLTTQQARAQLADIESALDEFTAKLKRERPTRGPAEHIRRAVDLIVRHIERWRDSLFGHIIELPGHTDGEFRLVDRTNNRIEGLFHLAKHEERRRSGRKNLAYDFEQLPEHALLAFNLRCTDYVSILCDSLAALPEAFAALDASKRKAIRQAVVQPPNAIQGAEPELSSASLPTRDRVLIRKPEMTRRITTAARSRAPRISLLEDRSTTQHLQPPAAAPQVIPIRAAATGS